MQTSTRKQAMELGFKTYFTGKPCKHGHIDSRYVVSNSCKSCVRISQKSENLSDTRKETKKQSHTNWRKNNPDKWKSYNDKWKSNNPEKVVALNNARNKTESVKNQKKIWAKENSEIITHHVVLRNARKTQAIPKWANKFLIKQFYVKAKILTIETGIKHVVDHIIPLKSAYVSGLHVENNLQVIPETDNLKKYNKFEMS